MFVAASWLAWPVVRWVILMRRPRQDRHGLSRHQVVQGLSFGSGDSADVQPAVMDGTPLHAAGRRPLVAGDLAPLTFPPVTTPALSRFVGWALIAVGSLAAVGRFNRSPRGQLANPLGGLSSLLSFVISDTGFLLVLGLEAAAVLSLILRCAEASVSSVSSIAGCSGASLYAPYRSLTGHARRLVRAALVGRWIRHPDLHRCCGVRYRLSRSTGLSRGL
jgi:hypothetical protein